MMRFASAFGQLGVAAIAVTACHCSDSSWTYPNQPFYFETVYRVCTYDILSSSNYGATLSESNSIRECLHSYCHRVTIWLTLVTYRTPAIAC